MEIIQRIGPCNAKIKVDKIEDVRISKRLFVVERAKELLRQLMDTSMPDSGEIADEVAASVRVMEIQEYGKERLPAGPAIDESDDIIIVEGRADVLTLLRHGFKNAIAINGTSVPETIKELCRHKETTVFVDGDRGGDLIIKELLSVTEIDFVTKAPDGKEVEELAKKEIHKALRSRIAAEQVKLEMPAASPQVNADEKRLSQKPTFNRPQQPMPQQQQRPMAPPVIKKSRLSSDERNKFLAIMNSLVGTRGAYILDEKLNTLGKVPVMELMPTLKSMNSGVYAVLLDGSVEKDLLAAADRSGVTYLIGMDANVKAGLKTLVMTISEI